MCQPVRRPQAAAPSTRPKHGHDLLPKNILLALGGVSLPERLARASPRDRSAPRVPMFSVGMIGRHQGMWACMAKGPVRIGRHLTWHFVGKATDFVVSDSFWTHEQLCQVSAHWPSDWPQTHRSAWTSCVLSEFVVISCTCLFKVGACT